MCENMASLGANDSLSTKNLTGMFQSKPPKLSIAIDGQIGWTSYVHTYQPQRIPHIRRSIDKQSVNGSKINAKHTHPENDVLKERDEEKKKKIICIFFLSNNLELTARLNIFVLELDDGKMIMANGN